MPQLRQNKITGEWVIIAPQRRTRPGASYDPADAHSPEHEPGCPFCPGNEAHIPPIILEVNSTERPWQTRVIPNKYPAVRSLDSSPGPTGADGNPVHGRHEVIIESPRHDVDIADMTVESVSTIIETYHLRYHEIRVSNDTLLPIVFRNRGARAGASLHHPHSQLIAVPLAPAKLRQEDDGAARYFDTHDRCPYCDQIAEETAATDRIVSANEHFVAVVPYAATAPFEVLLLPRVHRADFDDTSPEERRSLAEILQSTLRRLCAALGNPDYNYVIRSSVEHGATDPYLHWYVRIVPKLMQPGGFEVATGIPINSSNPEDDAAALRAAA